ncbi:MAG TPA: hypothetical protein VGH98_17700, partial [Gemmatimonadaceae bacterium]
MPLQHRFSGVSHGLPRMQQRFSETNSGVVRRFRRAMTATGSIWVSAQLETKLALLRGLPFRAATAHVLMERVRGKRHHDVVESLAGGGEIDARERCGILVEKRLRAEQRIEYSILL